MILLCTIVKNEHEPLWVVSRREVFFQRNKGLPVSYSAASLMPDFTVANCLLFVLRHVVQHTSNRLFVI